jgi:2'-5' RNA ligase
MRTFIAILLPENLLAWIARLQGTAQDALAAAQAGRAIRWTPPHNVHLTLRFLGETSPAQVQSIGAQLAELAQRGRPFDLQLRGLGCFPDYRQPRIIWAGLQGDLAALVQVQAQVERAAVAQGFAAEERSFQPHLTLGRARRDADRADLRQAGDVLHSLARPGEVGLSAAVTGLRVAEIVHMRSDLHPDGAEYTPIARFPFSPSP